MNLAQGRKVVLITGGSRGIGKALVQVFKEQGWNVAACATTDAAVKNNSSVDFGFKCDVSSSKEVAQGVHEVKQALGRIDALVNNAGLAGTNSLNPESDDELWHRIVDVNLHGTYYMCKSVSPYLPNGTGRIVNIASVLALKGVPDQTAYCAAKHGVLGFTRALAHALASRKITVNAVCPGWVRTDMAEGRFKDLGMTETDLATQVPLGRYIEPSEIAGLVFQVISSPAFSMMTGQALTMDGGVLS